MFISNEFQTKIQIMLISLQFPLVCQMTLVCEEDYLENTRL